MQDEPGRKLYPDYWKKLRLNFKITIQTNSNLIQITYINIHCLTLDMSR